MIKCGWASIDEKGHARGGKAGDQTGKEVKVGGWYDFSQNVVIRFKDRAKAKKAASICKKICSNNKVGYDQNQRTTLFDELKKADWDPDKISKKVETDCSAMLAAVCNAVGIKVNKNWWTGNMVAACKAHPKEFEILTRAKYLNSDKYLKTGDMIVNTARHTIMALEDGSAYGSAPKVTAPKATKKSNYTIAKEVIDGKWGNGETRKKKLKAAGYDYSAVQTLVNRMVK